MDLNSRKLKEEKCLDVFSAAYFSKSGIEAAFWLFLFHPAAFNRVSGQLHAVFDPQLF
jgi:hypothetical protein